MATKLDGLLPAIVAAGDKGFSFSALKTKFVGRSAAGAKAGERQLSERLSALVREHSIREPIKNGQSSLYFAQGRGPSAETAARTLTQLVAESGVKLLSKKVLREKVVGLHRRFFDDGIKHAIADQVIIELACGASKYYLHKDIAAEYFVFDIAFHSNQLAIHASRQPQQDLSFEDLLSIYRRLKAEQGGFSAVKIHDLTRALARPKELVHDLIMREVKAKRLSIHHTTSVELPKEVMDGGIRLPGFAEPFITVVVKDQQ